MSSLSVGSTRILRRFWTRYPCCNGRAYFDLFTVQPERKFERRCPRCGMRYMAIIWTGTESGYIEDHISWRVRA